MYETSISDLLSEQFIYLLHRSTMIGPVQFRDEVTMRRSLDAPKKRRLLGMRGAAQYAAEKSRPIIGPFALV